MSFLTHFTYFFRKYSFFRFFIIIFSLGSIFFLSVFFSNSANKKPLITAIDPPEGLPGDALVITGKFFDDNKKDSYVEIGGLRLTESSYLTWTETQIIVVLPVNIQDGLLYVFTKHGKSNPQIFTNKTVIPVIVPSDPQTALPVIRTIQEKSATVGTLITLHGKNFGYNRGKAQIFFSWGDARGTTNTTPALEKDFDYEFWSDAQIHVRVPDGAKSGNVFIQTEKGTSNPVFLEIVESGKKEYPDKRTYIVELAAEITNITADRDSVLVLRMPRPIITANQKTVEISDSNPVPLNDNLSDTAVFQYEPGKISGKKINTALTYIVSATGIETSVDPATVQAFSDTTRLLYTTYTRSDNIIFSNHPEIYSLSQTIIKTEKNPYIQAKLLYTYLLENCTILHSSRGSDTYPFDILLTKKGDAYDFAVFYVSLLRAAGIPAIHFSGILVDKTLATQNHWWAAFYIEHFGWIPVDPALGAGLRYEAFQTKLVPVKEYYFGNLDAQHIIFSYGVNALRQTLIKSNIVYRPKTFATQTIWEESNTKNLNYTSFWANPRIAGIY